MTTTDFGGFPPPPPPPTTETPRDPHLLRRVRDGRVGAGVAGGLGRYFGLDPVLFRVLFATAAFFGGAGIIAYLLAWAAIPDEGTARAPIDGWARALRQRRIPVWVAAWAVGLTLWLAAFSWWTPRPFFPILAVVILVIVLLGRRDWRGPEPPQSTATNDEPTVTLTKTPESASSPDAAAARSASPSWVEDTRAWVSEARAARRLRRRRALPVRIATLVALAVTLAVLGTIDALSGIPFVVYFWVTLGIIGVGLLAGIVARRTPWSLAVLLLPGIVGVVGFGGSHSSLHDGVGARQWHPTDSIASNYRLAFGNGVLDLGNLAAPSAPRAVTVTMGAGHVRVIAPRSLNLTVRAEVHAGDVRVDGLDRSNGYNDVEIVDPPAGATGAPLTVTVRLADGSISIDRI